MPSGKLRLIASISFFTDLATSMALAPGNMLMFSTAALPPLIPLSVLYDWASSEMRATSRKRVSDPSGLARITISSNSATDDNRPCAMIGVVTSMFSMGC